MGTSLIGILNMSQHSIANSQTALSVVSNNISNMNNSTYSKQSVVLNAMPAYDTYNWCSSVGSLQIGHGAEITAISRNRAQWLDNYYRDQNTVSGYYSQLGIMTTNIENMLNNELSTTGLQKKLSDFFSASQALTAEPTNNAYRISFLQAAEDVANMLNRMSSNLTSLREQMVGSVDDPDKLTSSKVKMTVDELNAKFDQLAKVNGDIAQSMASGSASNDLLDQRDALLDEISEVMPLKTSTNSNGTVDVYVGNIVAVKGGEVRYHLEAVQTTDDNNPVRIQLVNDEGTVKNTDISEFLTSGSLKAILDAGGSEELSYKSVLNEIDRIAKAFATEMNNIQTGTADGTIPYCFDENGQLQQATEAIFIAEGGGDFTAANIKINENLLKDPNLLATARGDANIDVNAVGNIQNMERFNALSTLKIANLSKTAAVGQGQTMTEFITSLVSSVGSQIQTLNQATTAQDALKEQATAKRTEYTGVDLNQELSDLIKFQRSYEASARVFNVATELMQILTSLGS